MTTGIYPTTDPNKRIRVVQDDDFYDDPYYAEGVREALLEAHEAGYVYGVIVEERETWARVKENADGSTSIDGAQVEKWVEVDSIWSCAGYDDVAVEVAKEHFGLTVVKG